MQPYKDAELGVIVQKKTIVFIQRIIVPAAIKVSFGKYLVAIIKLVLHNSDF